LIKTPLTITVSAWNYCQNTCNGCVSGSNSQKWKFNGNFDLYAPPGCEHLNDLQLRAKWGQDYYRRMCPDKNRFLNKYDILEFDYLIKWINTHAPAAEIHISGGEPLLRPDIEDQIQKMVTAKISTTIFTNGLLIAERPRLLSMPLSWVVAHHTPNDVQKWRRNVELIQNRPFLTTRVIRSHKELMQKNEIAKQYEGLNFVWSRFRGFKMMDFDRPKNDEFHIASGVIHLIVPDGRVFPCNLETASPIGHILTGDYWPDRARCQDSMARQCVMGENCAAYQSARIMIELKNRHYQKIDTAHPHISGEQSLSSEQDNFTGSE
jgi:organic radical activating enzyme